MIKQFISRNYLSFPKSVLKQIASPRNLVIEPIAGCNVVCSACPQDQLKRPYGIMTLPNFKHIIDEVNPTSIGLYFMGEPFLNPDIFKMIEYASNRGVKTVINTNGSTLIRDFKAIAESGLTKIAVSVDGYTQETFEVYRHGIDCEQVWRGLKLLTMMEQGPHIQVRTLAFDNTMKEIALIRLELKKMNIIDHRIIEPILTGWGGKVNADIGVLGDSGRVKNTRPKICPSLYRLAVTWDGEVLPCCNDVHGENSFGNIYQTSFDHIMWGNSMWKRKSKRQFNICANCYEDDE